MSGLLRATILGCGASPGVPRIGNDWGACYPSEPRNRRRRCALLLERYENTANMPTRVLVDTGPDIREQLLDADVGTADGVVFTHSHADHIHGIDDLRALWLNTRELVEVFSDAATRDRLDQAFGYCFRTTPGSFYPPMLRHNLIEYGTSFDVTGAGGPMKIAPFRQAHGDIDSLGVRVGGLAYSGDLSDLPPEALQDLDDLDLWIVDALRYRPHPSHFNVDDALAWIERVKPRRAVLTHLHGDLDYATLSAKLPPGVEVAYDGMTLDVLL